MTARRRFFRKLAAYASILGGTVFISSCDEENGKQSSTNTSPAEHGRQLLDAFVDTIVPSDQDPGAVEAGVATEMLARFSKKKNERKKVLLMLDGLDRLALQRFNSQFNVLTRVQRESVVKNLTDSQDKIDRPLQVTLVQQRSRIIRAFYLSPTGRAMLAYSPPYPAGYPDFNNPPPA